MALHPMDLMGARRRQWETSGNGVAVRMGPMGLGPRRGGADSPGVPAIQGITLVFGAAGRGGGRFGESSRVQPLPHTTAAGGAGLNWG